VNTTVAGNNGGNCLGVIAGITSQGPNLQVPDSGCGAAISVGDPKLRSNFSPGPSSPARGTGAVKVCAEHELVDGRDVYGEARSTASCTIGAVEADMRRDVLATLPFGLSRDLPRLPIIGIVIGMVYKKRRRAPRSDA
jgi:hypothetical protein